jgi:hypothetical protein
MLSEGIFMLLDLLTAIGFPPGGSVQCTSTETTITTKKKQHTTQ